MRILAWNAAWAASKGCLKIEMISRKVRPDVMLISESRGFITAKGYKTISSKGDRGGV